jgi:exoribonuclease R
LAQARKRVANDPVRRRLVDRLILANRHSRLTFEVLRAAAIADIVNAALKADKLMEFRTAHQGDLRMNWHHLFRLHAGTCGVDVAGLNATYDALTRKGQSLTALVDSAVNLATNGGFEDGMKGWNRGRWHDNRKKRKLPYSKDDETQVSTNDAFEGDQCLMVQVKPENREFVYGINQAVGPLKPGAAYLFRFAWKRRTTGALHDIQSLEWPRFRLTFMAEDKRSTDYGAIQSPRLWGSAGNTKMNTQWIQMSRLIRLSAKSRVRWVDVTFHFSSQSVNKIDGVEWLDLQ